jgi:hypothetical protein
MLWFGHVPLMVTLAPATSDGVAVPVPPFEIASIPVTPPESGTAGRSEATMLQSDAVVSTPQVPTNRWEVSPVAAAMVSDGVVVGLETEAVSQAGTLAEKFVTVPLLPEALIVWNGHEPVMVMLVPAISVGAALPVPPLAKGNIPATPLVREIDGRSAPTMEHRAAVVELPQVPTNWCDVSPVPAVIDRAGVVVGFDTDANSQAGTVAENVVTVPGPAPPV